MYAALRGLPDGVLRVRDHLCFSCAHPASHLDLADDVCEQVLAAAVWIDDLQHSTAYSRTGHVTVLCNLITHIAYPGPWHTAELSQGCAEHTATARLSWQALSGVGCPHMCNLAYRRWCRFGLLGGCAFFCCALSFLCLATAVWVELPQKLQGAGHSKGGCTG